MKHYFVYKLFFFLLSVVKTKHLHETYGFWSVILYLSTSIVH